MELRRRRRSPLPGSSTEPSGSGLRKPSAVVLVGGASGALVALALSPVLSRVYDPAEFGAFSAAVAVSSSLVGFSTLRLEVLALGVRDKDESNRLVWLGFLVLLGITLFVFGATGLVYSIANMPVWSLLIAPMVFFASLQLIGGAIYVRRQEYKRLSTANFLQQAGTPVFQVSLGAVGMGVYGLLAGFALARAAWLPSMIEMLRSSRPRMIDGPSHWSQVRKGLVPGFSGLINSIGGQLIILIPIALYGNAVGGLIGMAVRIIISPLSLVSQSVASAANGQVGLAFRSGHTNSAIRIIHRGMRDQAMIATVPLIAVGVGAPWIVTRLLGEQWRETGFAISALALGALFQFAVAPFAQILNIAGQSRALISWDTSRLLIYSIALVLPYFLGLNWIASIWSYSIAQVILYVGLAWLITRRIRAQAGPLN